MAKKLDPMDLKQIIRLHLDGLSNREISKALGIGCKAVKWLRWVCNSFPNLFYHWTLGYQLT